MLVGAQVSIGMLFGATQTGATVLATDAGTPGVAGLVHATLGVGSAIAGLATAYLPERIGHERRALVAAWALLVLSLPLLAVGSLAGTAATVLFLGFAVAPYMIAVFSLAERVVPAARVGAAMTTLASATGLGYALGSSLAGRLADAVAGDRGVRRDRRCDGARGRADVDPAAAPPRGIGCRAARLLRRRPSLASRRRWAGAGRLEGSTTPRHCAAALLGGSEASCWSTNQSSIPVVTGA